MDSEHRDLVTKTRALIETTRREILQLGEEIESARHTVDRSQRLLSRTAPATRRTARRRKEPRAGQQQGYRPDPDQPASGSDF